MDTVKALYEEFKDMDFMDYSDTIENDFAFIADMVNNIGIDATRQYLADL